MGQILKALMPAYGGYAIARDEKIIFIRGAIPGEVVDVGIEDKKKDYSVGRVLQVIEPSEFRTEPPCPVFGICGGCQLQYITYEKQVAMKDEVLADSLARLGGIEIGLEPPLTDTQWHYRHRAQFKVSKTGEIGFFRELSRDVVTFEECPLLVQKINDIFRAVRQKDIIQNLSEIHISAGDTPVALLRGRDYDRAQFESFIEAGLSGIAYNDEDAYGGDFTGFDLNGLRYTVSPRTFFQSHWSLNTAVVATVLSLLGPLEGKRVLDLYAGAGNFALPLAAGGAEVIAVEENPRAVEDGKRNAGLNEIKKCRFVASSAEKYKVGKKFDIIVLDPPRPGLTSEVTKKVLENPADTIVYISCNPSTLARDLKKLKAKYDIVSVQQMDFFPNTYHIEAMAFLRLR